jgi:SAM-dependent methyltransferase
MTNSIKSGDARIPEALEQIASLLACPQCGEALRAEGQAFVCGANGHNWPVQDGIAMLARRGTANSWQEDSGGPTSQAYQDQYQDLDRSVDYNHAYRDKFFKRQSTLKEFKLLRRLLGSQEHCETLLDVPCGGGRLSPQMEPYTDLLIEADAGLGQLRFLQSAAKAETARAWMLASAFHLPFKPQSVDGLVCVRLCHHLPTPVERERLIAELLRVARRFVIMTFFDYHSPKNYWRRARQPYNHKPPKLTMTVARVRELAREHGADLIACPSLWWLSSGHRYALMVKK